MKRKESDMNFQIKKFSFSGESLYYDGNFVARFKWDKRDKTSFRKFLTENFTIKEYFEKIEENKPPLRILGEKGYVTYNVRKMLQRRGYPQDAEGLIMYRRDNGMPDQ